MCRSTAGRSVRAEAVAERGASVERNLRASDADRERVARSLSDHGAAGRLTTEELEERLARALEARTLGDLEDLMADLPVERGSHRVEARREAARRGFREHLRTYLMVMVLLVTIWALTGMGYFWPVWPMVGWGIGLWSHAACVPSRRRAARRDPAVQV